MKMLATVALLSAFTCAAQQPMQFKVTDSREEVPHFKHIYAATTELRGHIKFEMKAETESRFHCNQDYSVCSDGPFRTYVVTLTQADGKDLNFDPRQMPERLIDRDLVPWVSEECKWSLRYDHTFMASNPSEFIAKDGWHWRRVPKVGK